jgi:AAA domain
VNTAEDDARLAADVKADAEAERKRTDGSYMHDNPDQMGVPITWAHDYPAVRAPVTIVAGLLEAGTLAVMFGEANTGKSTLALDLALHVARGAPWRSRRTCAGFVLWLALESAAGLRRRVCAHLNRHDLDPAAVAFADTTAGLRLLELEDLRRVVQTVHDAERVCRQAAALVVVDTVARALAGGDENDGRDMGTLIRGCDLIRAQTGATVLLIHHSGKDSTRGARGHSSLRAAVDTEIEITGQTNPRQAKVTKQRDLPNGPAFAFDLEPVEIGRDEDTREPVTACVIVHRDDVPAELRRPTGQAQQQILRALRSRQQDADGPLIWTLTDLRRIGRDAGQAKSTARSAVDGLIFSGFLTPSIGGHRLANGSE